MLRAMKHLYTLKDFGIVLCLSIFVTALLNISAILSKAFGGDEVIAFSQTFIVETFSDTLLTYASMIFTPNLLTLFFWGLAGLVVYVITEITVNGFAGLKETLQIDTSYKHPKWYSRKRYWIMTGLKLAFHVGMAMLMALWTYLFFSYFVTFSSTATSVALTSIDLGEILIYTFYAVLAVYTGLMGYLVYWRIFLAYREKF